MASGAASAMATEPSSQASSGTAPEPSTLDLEAYSANYVGITRIKRLAFIASARRVQGGIAFNPRPSRSRRRAAVALAAPR